MSRYFMSNNRLAVKWNLPRLAADLAVYLEPRERSGEGDAVADYERFLDPYNLSPSDFSTVVRLATGDDCEDCGRLFGHYMVHDAIWKLAGLVPTDNCCGRCLARRLKRPLKLADFSCW
jgi:hypothetical protein